MRSKHFNLVGRLNHSALRFVLAGERSVLSIISSDPWLGQRFDCFHIPTTPIEYCQRNMQVLNTFQ